MKDKLRILGLLISLCGAVGSTAVFGQTTYVWTNQFPTLNVAAGDLGLATNWSPNGVPIPNVTDGITFGDEMRFDGRTTGPLVITGNAGPPPANPQNGGAGSGQPYGLRIHLTSNQTASVTIYSPVGTAAGLRMNSITIDAGSGGLSVGIGGSNNTNVLDILAGVLNAQIFGFTNNGSVPSTINQDLRFRMGGAGFHPHIFAGTGNWIVNNHMRSCNGSAIGVQIEGPGTTTWTGTNVGLRSANWFDNLGTPIRINGGTLILKSSDLVGTDAGSPNIVHNGVLLKYDVQPTAAYVTGPESITANISGAGPIQINAGTLTLSGANTFSGSINLTGGELIAGSTENVGVNGPLGQGGIISFNGGTLGWNLANAFDYSSRFDTTANQAYTLDTGGSSPTFGTGLSSSGGSLTKLGGGTLTLAGASTYTGLTTVSGGTLAFQGTKSGNANITVADSVTLGVYENDSQITPNTLTLGTSTGATLEFNNVTNHITATLVPGTLAATGPVTINVNSGRFRLINELFPLLKWTTGPAPAVTLGFLAGAGGHLVTNISGVEIDLVIDNPPFIWTDLAADDTWNTTSIDWLYSGANVAWTNGNFSLMDDTAGGTGNVTLSGTIAPTNATINNSTLAYVITSSGGNFIGGGGSLTKSGNGTLTLPGGVNTYTGVTTVGGGILGVTVLANGSAASDIGAASTVASNIVFNGGTLQYTGPGVSIDRLFSVGPGGGTIESAGAAALVFNNSGSLGMSGNGPRTLTLTGVNGFGDTIASAIVNHPAGTSLSKNGVGTWILTGTNTYAGGTALLNGSLQVGAGGLSGTLGNGNIGTAAGTGIDFLRTGTLLVPGAISGSCGVTNDGTGTVILANNSTYNGGTTINAGTLQVGNGGGTGSLLSSGPILNNSLLVFNTAGTFTYGSGAAGIISGTGNVIVQGGGFIKAIGNNIYLGWTRIDANTTFQPHEGQDGGLVSSVVTNNGTLRLARQDALFTYPGPIVGSGKVQIGANAVNFGVITLTGTNTYSGGTFIGGNTLVLGDGVTPGAGAIAGNVQFVNNFNFAQDNPRTLTFNRPDDFTFTGTITTNFTSAQSNRGIVQQNGLGRLILTGNNTYGSGTVINAGALVIGNGGSSGTVGFGPVALNSGAPLVINRSGSFTIGGNISGAADLLLNGGATVTLNGANNTYTGSTTVSNGTLIVNGADISSSTVVYVGGFGGTGTLTGPVTLQPGTTLRPGASVGTLTINSGLSIGGNLAIEVNKSLSPSNDLVLVTGVLTNTGTGTLTVSNLGPALAVGDKFTLFSKPLLNGAALTVVGAGVLWTNTLAVDGSIRVIAPPTLNFTRTGNNIQFSWTGSFKLQAQTNSLSVGLGTNWADYPGGGNSGVIVPIDPANGTVFFRLVSP